jgi:HAD superfamily hydrolase (TIGR01509 family)
MAALAAVLLDIDGTLLDSNDAHAAAWHEALERVGHPVPLKEIRGWIGMGGDALLAQIGLSDAEGPGHEAGEIRKSLVLQRMSDLRPLPGARDLLLRMRDEGLDLVVATSASAEELTGLLAQAGVADLVRAATTADDAERSKPAPDIVEAALERAGVPAREALLLGDTPYDLEAARRAGVGFVAVRSGGWPFDARKGPMPLAVFDDARALLEQWDRSPFARACR